MDREHVESFEIWVLENISWTDRMEIEEVFTFLLTYILTYLLTYLLLGAESFSRT